jgi:hypothetical protein
MEHWWKDIDRGKLKYLEKKLPQCQFVHHTCSLGSRLLSSADKDSMSALFTDIRLFIIAATGEEGQKAGDISD